MMQQKSSIFYGAAGSLAEKGALIGMLWYIVKGVFDVAVNSDMRFLSQTLGYHPLQLVFFYSFMAACAYLPDVLRRPRHYIPVRRRLYVMRGVLEVCGFTLVIFSVTMMPFATFTVITFITPVIASLAAVYVLGEQMTSRKWVGIILGFCGIVIVARPDTGSINWGVPMLLGAACCFSLCAITIRKLAATEPASRIAFVTLSLMAAFSLPLALPHWKMPELEHLPYLALLGIAAASCQFCVGKALSYVDVTTVQPLTFLTLIWSSIVGYLWFHEQVEWSAIIGAVFIISGIIYSVRRPRTVDAATLGTQPTP